MPRQGQNPKRITRQDGTSYWRITYSYWVHPSTGAPVPMSAPQRTARIKREHGGGTKSDALTKLGKRRSQAREGQYIDPAYQRKQDAIDAVQREVERGPLVKDLLPDYIPDQMARNHSEYVEVAWAKTRHLYGQFADKHIKEITPKMIAVFRDWLLTDAPVLSNTKKKKTGLSNSTARLYMAQLSRLFVWSIEHEHTDRNPVREIEKPAPSKPNPDPVSPAEWTLILREAQKDEYPSWVADIMQVMLGLGTDISDVAGLKWSALGVGDRKRVSLIRHKTRQPFTVELNPTVLAIFRRQIRRTDSPYIFHDQDRQPFAGRRQCQRASRFFRRVIDRAGVVGKRAKSLRHSMATWRCLAGEDVYSVMGAMGHRSLEMTSRYAQAAHKTGFEITDMASIWAIVENGIDLADLQAIGE